jgi:hypothetical protein
MWKRFQMGRLARLAGRFPWHALANHFAYDLHSLRPTQRGPQQPPPHRRARCCQNASRGIGVNRRRARSSLGVSFRITGRVGDRTFRKVVYDAIEASVADLHDPALKERGSDSGRIPD